MWFYNSSFVTEIHISLNRCTLFQLSIILHMKDIKYFNAYSVMGSIEGYYNESQCVMNLSSNLKIYALSQNYMRYPFILKHDRWKTFIDQYR